MSNEIIPTLFDFELSDSYAPANTITKAAAEKLFSFFSSHPLFKWSESHNGCEARADAVSVLLNEWKIPHCKAWVFGGAFLKNHIGALQQNWNYHVAPALQVKEGSSIILYVLDPATAGFLQTVNEWAAGITSIPHTYYCTRQPVWYIFQGNIIKPDNWNKRNRQNRKWMIQGLAGINSLSAQGKAMLCFNKTRIKNTAAAFTKLKMVKPQFL
jgi:Glutaminase